MFLNAKKKKKNSLVNVRLAKKVLSKLITLLLIFVSQNYADR